jgi:hypothetical protein
MPPKPRGRPPKKRRNITGLQNSASSSTVLPVISFSQGNQAVTKEDNALIARYQQSDQLPVRNKKDEASSEAEDSGKETDEEDYAESEWDELDDQGFAERLAEMAIADDPNDLDWVPLRFRRKKGKISYMYLQVSIKNSYDPAPGNQSESHDGHRRLDEPCSPGCWGCRSLSPNIQPYVDVI